MAVLPVLVLPQPVLISVAKPLVEIGEEARKLADDLVETMRASPACVGLAAPQVGVPLRAFVVDVTGHPKAESSHGCFVLFNPEVVALSGSVTAREGCMSVPDLTGDVARAQSVTISGLGLDGDLTTLDVDSFEARAVLHELDHLDGKLFLDRVAGPHAVFERKVYR
jgi:peptide deformylase